MNIVIHRSAEDMHVNLNVDRNECFEPSGDNLRRHASLCESLTKLKLHNRKLSFIINIPLPAYLLTVNMLSLGI